MYSLVESLTIKLILTLLNFPSFNSFLNLCFKKIV